MKSAGYIYFFKKDDKYLKIGFSADIDKRKKAIEREYSCKLDIIRSFYSKDAFVCEIIIHKYFQPEIVREAWTVEQGKHREWFYLSDYIKEFLQATEGKSLNDALQYLADNQRTPEDKTVCYDWKSNRVEMLNTI